MQVDRVLIGGGEPLLVAEIFEIVERLVAGGIAISFYTNGLGLTDRQARELARLGVQVHVSIDGPTAEVNDRIRGRQGAYASAVETLELLNSLAAEIRGRGEPRFLFGIDVTLLRSNFSQIENFCTEFAPRFSELGFMQFGAVIPSGLATEESFAHHEVLTEDQLKVLAEPSYETQLAELAPSTLKYVCTSHNLSLQLHSETARGMAMPYAEVMEIEPDGAVRALVTYEGVVGNILHDPPDELWRRCQERVHHPLLVQELSAVTTPEEWAAAVRRLDAHFGTADDLVRIKRRTPYSTSAHE